MSKPDFSIGKRSLLTTKDYEKFKTMGGNRTVNKTHVKELQRLMIDNGNLTAQFPIIVSADYEIIDGQHRFEALKNLGWEIGYTIQDGATINMVRAINLGNRNWNWRDMAESYSSLGNAEYTWFLKFVESYKLGFSLALRFCNVKGTQGMNGSLGDFSQGYLFVDDKPKAVAMAKHWNEVVASLDEDATSREFGYAIHKLHQSPFYKEERMIQKLKEKGHTLPRRAVATDYQRLLEELYNDSIREENRVRLF